MGKIKKFIDINASGDVGFDRLPQQLSRELLSGAAGGIAGGAGLTAAHHQIAPRVVPQSMLPSAPAPSESCVGPSAEPGGAMRSGPSRRTAPLISRTAR
jgi:hypothetical protein